MQNRHPSVLSAEDVIVLFGEASALVSLPIDATFI